MKKITCSMLQAAALGIVNFPLSGVLAQEAAPSPSADGTQVEDIVVTAEKRAARLQEVPLSISAFTAASLKSLQITSSEDLSIVTPGLTITRQLNTIQPFIRGIGAIDSTVGQESKTAIYVDGVYQSSPIAGMLALNNIERIEVLKGPQGTLFGRNAVAGVVQIITRDPSHTARTDMSVGYGNFSTVDLGFYATRGITDNLAADLAIAYNDQLDGWGKNLVTGRDAFRSRNFSARSKWKLDIGNDTTATFSAYYDRAYSQSGSGFRQLLPGRPLITGHDQYPGFYNITHLLDPVLDAGTEPYGKKKSWGLSLTVNHDLSWARIVSISAYQNVKATNALEITALPFPLIALYQPMISTSRSQELQLLSLPESPVKWIAGLYYFYNRSGYNPTSLLTGAAFGGGDNFVGTTSKQSALSYAAFGQVTVPLGSSTNVQAGLRYTTDKRHVVGHVDTLAGVGPTTDASKRFNKLTYKFSLDHKLAEDAMVYGLYSRGFKGGLFNTFVPSSPAVRPEVMDTFEGGFKTEWLDHALRLNVSAFYNKIRDLQVVQIVSGSGTSISTNAAAAKSKGVEVELTAVPVSRFTLTASGSYVDAKYTKFPGAQFSTPNPAGGNTVVAGDAGGNSIASAPKWSGSVRASYEVPTSSGNYGFDVLYSYTSTYFWREDNRVRQPKLSLVNGSINWSTVDRVFGITLWGKNLLDKKYYSLVQTGDVGDLGSPAAPRTFGVTLKAQFR